MKNILILVSCILFAFNTYAQHSLGLTANIGASRVYNSTIPVNLTPKTSWGPSGHIGAFYHLQTGKHSSLGTELLFMQIEGRASLKRDNIIGGYIEEQYYTHLSYLSFPVYYGYKVKKFTFNLGFQIAFLVANSYRTIGESTYLDQTHNWDETISDNYINRFEAGPRMGVFYHITDRISIEATYYYGLNNLVDVTKHVLRAQQATFGVKYSFISNTKEKTN